jgi:hypothetical protein
MVSLRRDHARMPSRPVTDQQVQRYMHYRQQHPQAIAAAIGLARSHGVMSAPLTGPG